MDVFSWVDPLRKSAQSSNLAVSLTSVLESGFAGVSHLSTSHYRDDLGNTQFTLFQERGKMDSGRVEAFC